MGLWAALYRNINVILLWVNDPRICGATEICHFVPQEQEEWIVQVKRDNGRGWV